MSWNYQELSNISFPEEVISVVYPVYRVGETLGLELCTMKWDSGQLWLAHWPQQCWDTSPSPTATLIYRNYEYQWICTISIWNKNLQNYRTRPKASDLVTTNTHTLIHSLTHYQTKTYSQSLTHSLTLSHYQIYTHTNIHKLTLTHSLSHLHS